MRIDECEVWVTSEGQRLPEYDTQPKGDDGKTFACFIPSEAGKNFRIEWQNTSTRDTLRFSAKLDGTHVGRKWCRQQEADSLVGFRSATTIQSFQFSQLQTTDADDALHVPVNADLGTIRVQVVRVKLESAKNPKPPNFTSKFHSVGPVNERSKKLGAHCVTLGEATEVGPPSKRRWTSQPIDPEEGPIAVFLFHYRPQALLQAQDIAPPPLRSPEPSHASSTRQDSEEDGVRPVKRQRAGTGSDSGIDLKPHISNPSDDDGDEDDDDELGMLKGQLSQIMDRITQMEQKKKKRRKGGGSLKVKKEEPVASSSRLGAGSEDPIDLTLSD